VIVDQLREIIGWPAALETERAPENRGPQDAPRVHCFHLSHSSKTTDPCADNVEGMTTPHATINLKDAKDVAPDAGMGELGEARFVRDALGAQRIGLAHYRVHPGQRAGFCHRHRESEEMYVILSGSGRFKVEDDVFPVAARDVVYCPAASMRAWEAGPDGLEILAFGGHVENESELQPGWWTD